jgi:hypothetical protein
LDVEATRRRAEWMLDRQRVSRKLLGIHKRSASGPVLALSLLDVGSRFDRAPRQQLPVRGALGRRRRCRRTRFDLKRAACVLVGQCDMQADVM